MKKTCKNIIFISVFVFMYQPYTSLFSEKSAVNSQKEIKDTEVPAAKKAGDKSREDKTRAEKRKKYVNSLLQSIKHDSSTERRNSIAAIKSLEPGEKEEFIPILKKLALEDLDYFVRESSIRMLGELERKDAEDVFIRALNDNKTDVKRAAIRSLSRINSEKSGPILEMIKKEDFSEYSILLTSSIRLLGKMKYKDAASFLKDKCMDAEINKENRRAVILYFGSAEVVDAKEFLLTMAKDDGEEISFREYAVNSLGKIKDKSVIPDFHNMYDEIRSLKNKQERAQFSRLKMQIIAALIRLGDDSVIPEILSAARDDDPNLRIKAIRQIGEMKLEAARDLLEFKAAHDMSEHVKKEAKIALNRMDGKNPGETDDEEISDESSGENK